MTDTVHEPPAPPVVGNAPRMAADPLRFLVGVQAAYGDRYQLVRVSPSVGQELTVVTDPELVHEVLADRERFRRPTVVASSQRRQGLLSSDGELWERQRSVLQPEFVSRRLFEYAATAGESVAEMTDEWPAEGELELFEETSIMTMRVITRSLFDQDAGRERARRVHEAVCRQETEFELGVDDLLLPERLQSGPSEEFVAANETLDEVATEFIDAHFDRENPPKNVLSALAEAQADPDVELSENELLDETVLFMTAGQTTTALTVSYAFYWLSRNSAARERVRAEAEAVLDGDPPGWDDLDDLSYTERVVRETLRLTPAVWNVTREPRESVRLAGVPFEEGDPLLLPSYAHHRDPSVWDDPEAFRPERWAGEVSRSEDSYFPFGSGPRVCIGRQIALLEAQFALAHVLQEYDLTVVDADAGLDLQPGVTLQPEAPLRASVTRLD
ncbi:MAG: cytochrome P450 [Halolamina sp.]